MAPAAVLGGIKELFDWNFIATAFMVLTAVILTTLLSTCFVYIEAIMMFTSLGLEKLLPTTQ